MSFRFSKIKSAFAWSILTLGVSEMIIILTHNLFVLAVSPFIGVLYAIYVLKLIEGVGKWKKATLMILLFLLLLIIGKVFFATIVVFEYSTFLLMRDILITASFILAYFFCVAFFKSSSEPK